MQQSRRGYVLGVVWTIPDVRQRCLGERPIDQGCFQRECLFQLAQVWSTKLRVRNQSQGKEKGLHHMTTQKKIMKHIAKNTSTITTTMSPSTSLTPLKFFLLPVCGLASPSIEVFHFRAGIFLEISSQSSDRLNHPRVSYGGDIRPISLFSYQL